MKVKKTLALVLALIMSFSLAVPSFAATDVTSDGGNGNTDVLLEQAASLLQVRVPTSLPLYLDEDGEVLCADSGVAKIYNDSYGPVEVTACSIENTTDWSLLDYGTDFRKVKVDKKNYAFRLNGNAALANDGSISTDGLPVINGKSDITLEYEGKVAAQSSALANAVISAVVFTINWSKGENQQSEPQMTTVNFTIDGVGYQHTYNPEYPLTASFNSWLYSENNTAGVTALANPELPLALLNNKVIHDDNHMVYLANMGMGRTMITEGAAYSTSQISFTIDGVEYKSTGLAEETAMMWSLTPANTGGIKSDNSKTYNNMYVMTNANGDIIDLNGTPVTRTTRLTEGAAYTTGQVTIDNPTEEPAEEPEASYSFNVQYKGTNTFNIETGMTFEEFVNSALNPKASFTITDGKVYYNKVVITLNNAEVNATDTIVDGATYETGVGGVTDDLSDPTQTQTETIKFTIDNVEYTAESEMTAEEWVETDYNTAGVKYSEGNIYTSNNDVLKSNDGFVAWNTVIEDGDAYTSYRRFVIDTVTYNAVAGYTLSQWIASNDNTANFTESEGNIYNSDGKIIYRMANPITSDTVITWGLTLKSTPTSPSVFIGFSIDGNPFVVNKEGTTISEWVDSLGEEADYKIVDGYLRTSSDKSIYSGSELVTADHIIVSNDSFSTTKA